MKNATSSGSSMTLLVTTLAGLGTSFAISSVNVALPLIGSEFHLGSVTLNWVVTAFVLTSAALVMPLGKIADRFGRQRIFSLGMVVFGLGGLVSLLAPDGFWLIAARMFAGFGAAFGNATMAAILVGAYPPNQRGRVLGINVAAIYLGLSAGPALGGWIVQLWGWRSLFVGHLGLGILLSVLAFSTLKTQDQVKPSGHFDWQGTLLYVVGLALTLVGVSNLPQISGIVLALFGVALIVLFLVWESRAQDPLFPVKLFAGNRLFLLSNVAAMLSYSATFAVAFFMSLYLEVVRTMPPSLAGVILITQPLVQAVCSPITGRLSDRVSPRWLASLGMGLTALGLVLLAFLNGSTPIGAILAPLALLGVGFALFSSPNTNSIMGSVEKPLVGVASATVATMRVVGQMLSMALALVLLALFVGHQEVTAATASLFLTALQWAFGISAALCSLGVVASLARGSASSNAPLPPKI